MNRWKVEFPQRAASGQDTSLLKFPVEGSRASRKSKFKTSKVQLTLECRF